MSKSLLLLLLLFTSCNSQTKEPRPNRAQTLTYLSDNLSNGSKVIGFSYMERSISFQVIGDKVIYVSEYIHPNNKTHWELTQRFSLADISSVSESTTNKIKSIDLNLKNRDNHRITRSVNGKPIHYDIPVDEMIPNVYITVEPNKFDGVKKAFENLLYLRREHNKADFFEK